MEEFTNGAFSTKLTVPALTGSHTTERIDARCPFCGWVYDSPEELVPSHAACGHLVATSQWENGSAFLNAAAFLGEGGKWLFWKESHAKQGKQSIEHAFASVSAKVESATASTESLTGDDKLYCRFYFSRRPLVVMRELTAAEPGAPNLTAERIRNLRRAPVCHCRA